jgi:hypothetical protein
MEPINNKSFDFSQALLHLKDGSKVARTGWNGKNMYIVLQKGYPNGMAINKNFAEATGIPENTVCKFLPYIMMKTADEKNTFVPWLASQTDILGTDWTLIEKKKQEPEKEPDPIPEDTGEVQGDKMADGHDKDIAKNLANNNKGDK